MTQEFVTLPREVVEQSIDALSNTGTQRGQQPSQFHAEGVSINALRAALDQPQAEQPAMTPIAQRKLDSLLAEGYTISGYSIYHEQKHQHGFVTGAGLVGWWKPEGVEYPQQRCEQEPDWSDSKTLPSELWKNPLLSLQERLQIADGAVQWNREVAENLRARLCAAQQPQGEQEPRYLAGGSRYKVTHLKTSGYCILGIPKELLGRWVALVDATDNKHMDSHQQPRGERGPVAEITGMDEYGPMLLWHKHWAEFPIGTKLYTHPQNINCKSTQASLATLWGYTKEQPKRPPLTDNQIDKIAESMPGGLEGFLKGWGWRQFARAVLENDHNIK